MNPVIEILSQGEEITTGQIADTNAAWLSQQAVVLGFNVARHNAVGDKLMDLVQVLRDIAMRADCCICTGGLGPTSDDLTAEAVAQAFDRPLLFDEIAFNQIRQFFANRQRIMPECNRKQALLPKDALRLDNLWGTAPGFALQAGRCWFAFAPGVPAEMRQMFLAYIKPELQNRFVLQPSRLITIKTAGIGESDLQERIDTIEIPPQVQLGFRAEWGEVQTKLLFPGGYPQDNQDRLENRIVSLLGDAVYAVAENDCQDNDLVSVVAKSMAEKSYTLSAVETLSQGLLAAKLAGMPWLLNSVYERAIEKLFHDFNLSYDRENLISSSQALAQAVQSKTDASMISVQLYSGQDCTQSNSENAVTVTTVLLVNGEFKQSIRILAGDLKRKQHQAVLLVLDVLRRYLQGKAIV